MPCGFADYKIGMLKKQQLYQQQGKKLISLYPDDKPRVRELVVANSENSNKQKECWINVNDALVAAGHAIYQDY